MTALPWASSAAWENKSETVTVSPEAGTLTVAAGNSIGAFTEIVGKTVTITNWNADDAGGGTPIRPSPFRS